MRLERFDWNDFPAVYYPLEIQVMPGRSVFGLAAGARSGVSLKHRLEYVAVRGLIVFVRARCRRRGLPHLGSLIGRIACGVDRRHRRIAEANVAAALPSRSSGRPSRDIVRGAFQHFGRLLLEFLRFDAMSPEAMLAHVEFEGEDRARARHTRTAKGRCCSSPDTSAIGNCRRSCTPFACHR